MDLGLAVNSTCNFQVELLAKMNNLVMITCAHCLTLTSQTGNGV